MVRHGPRDGRARPPCRSRRVTGGSGAAATHESACVLRARDGVSLARPTRQGPEDRRAVARLRSEDDRSSRARRCAAGTVMLQLVVIAKAVNEVALMALLGQGARYVLAGAKRETNPVYAILKAITSPVMKLARAITPRVVLDRHIGFVALFVVLVVEALLIVAKVYLVLTAPR